MRYLNKVVFINSAKTQYAEVPVSGNVHFVGNQGAGKSTLLRALLFFYNADTQGLGIVSTASDKRPFAEYYFQFDNSFIVYEVIKEQTAFCVVAYRTANSVSYRFIAGAYQKDWFIENDKPIDSWESVTKKLNEQQVFYTRKRIDEYKEYRDILYGNTESKKSEFKQFALMETKEYQYVYKTIQNVFLNSKMDAEFIKQTIIMSLENDIEIKLNNYNHHLRDFDTQFADIKKFGEPIVEKKANDIAANFLNIKYLDGELANKYSNLLTAIAFNADAAIQLKNDLQYNTAALNKEYNVQIKLEKAAETKNKEWDAELSVLNSKLQESKQKKEKYQQLNIEGIIWKCNQKEFLIMEKNRLEAEKNILMATYQEQANKYKMLLDNLKNNFDTNTNILKSEELVKNNEYFKNKEGIEKNARQEVQALQFKYKEIDKQFQEKMDAVIAELQAVELQLNTATYKIWHESEIKQLQEQITASKNKLAQAKVDKERLMLEKEIIRKNGLLDEEKIVAELTSKIKESVTELSEHKQKEQSLQKTIASYDQTFLKWLEDNYPNWHNTIGKVVKEEILLDTHLAPSKIDAIPNLYGISINADSVQKSLLGIKHYISALNAEKISIESIEQQIRQFEKDQVKSLDNIKQRIKAKISDCNSSIQKLEIVIQQNLHAEEQAQASLLATVEKGINNKQQAVLDYSNQIEKLNYIKKETFANRQATVETEQKLIKKTDKEFSDTLKNLESNLNECISAIQLRANELKNAFILDQQKIDVDKQKELKDNGADIEKIKTIELDIKVVNDSLQYIDQNIRVVYEYEKDKQELFDKETELKQTKKKVELESADFNKESTYKLLGIKSKIDQLNINKNVMLSYEKKLLEDATIWDENKDADFVNYIKELTPGISGIQQEYISVAKMITELRQQFNKLLNAKQTLKDNITSYLDNFSIGNILNLKLNSVTELGYLQFAEMLQEFLAENKIDKISEEVAGRFASIINTISNEASRLLQARSKIHDVITKINKDFKETDFVTAIKNIELKIEETENEIVKILNAIHDFNTAYGMELGALNLFSTNNQSQKNQQAIDLLKRFATKIKDAKKESITLSDAFELRFKIQENDNDTGWQEKISNVGSEGTDILVKALLNIMLLNVFKKSASKNFSDFKLHCMMDEIGKLHPVNVRGIIKFANDRNIFFINGSPYENDAMAFNYIYKLNKVDGFTRVVKLISKAN
jgi:hypothetical protein